MKKNNNSVNNDFIYLSTLFSEILKFKKLIFYITISIFLISIIYVISIPNIYKSSSTFYPHYEKMQTNGLKQLAGIAGLSLNSDVNQDVPPNLYPNILSAVDFKKQILSIELNINDNQINYYDYLKDKVESSFLSLILSPINIIRELLSNQINKSFSKKNNENILVISDEEFKIHELLENLINIEVNEKDGYIFLSVIDKNPLVSSIVATNAEQILQKKIIEFKLKNINSVYEFTIQQFEVAKNNLYKIQEDLANFKDSNKNIKSDLFLNQKNRLENELTIAKNIYNELALSKERSAIEVKRNTPIFTIINPVVVPNKKHEPNRTKLVLIITILGLFMSTGIIFLKIQIQSILKSFNNKN